MSVAWAGGSAALGRASFAGLVEGDGSPRAASSCSAGGAGPCRCAAAMFTSFSSSKAAAAAWFCACSTPGGSWPDGLNAGAAASAARKPVSLPFGALGEGALAELAHIAPTAATGVAHGSDARPMATEISRCNGGHCDMPSRPWPANFPPAALHGSAPCCSGWTDAACGGAICQEYVSSKVAAPSAAKRSLACQWTHPHIVLRHHSWATSGPGTGIASSQRQLCCTHPQV